MEHRWPRWLVVVAMVAGCSSRDSRSPQPGAAQPAPTTSDGAHEAPAPAQNDRPLDLAYHCFTVESPGGAEGLAVQASYEGRCHRSAAACERARRAFEQATNGVELSPCEPRASAHCAPAYGDPVALQMSWGRDQDEVFFANICFPSQQACQQAPAAMAEQERQLRSGFHRAGPCIDYPATRQLLPAVAESERAFFCFRLRGETTSCAISAEVCRDQARHELADLDAPDHCAKRSSAVCFWSRDTDDNVSAACALTIDDCHALRRKLAHPDGRQGACQKIGTSI